MVEYKVGDCGYIRYYLAPKIDDNEDNEMEEGGDDEGNNENADD